MRHDDEQLPEPRRAGLPLFRRAKAAPVTADSEQAPRIADLSLLLADIDQLRTILSTDLSLAAAALEAGAAELASELVDGDLYEIHSFEARALAHLASLDAPAVPAVVPPVVPAVVPAEPLVLPLARRPHRLPAAPLVATAAAVIGLLIGVVPDRAVVTPPTTPASAFAVSQASYQLAWMTELADQGASTNELRVAAQELNAKFADLIAGAKNDPVAAHQTLLLVQAGTQFLAGQADQGALSGVLARTRELERELRKVLPRPVRTAVPDLTVFAPDHRTNDRAPNGTRPSSSNNAARATSAPSPRPASPAASSPTPAPPKRTAAPSSSPKPAASPDGSSPSPAPLPAPPRIPTS